MSGILVDKYGRDMGWGAIGLIRIAANVADVETVTIGSTIYEFDRAADGVVAGNVAVTGHADDTPANATDALISTINANPPGVPVRAVDISDNEILIVSKGVSDEAVVLAETMGGANNEVQSVVAGDTAIRYVGISRVPNATEVAFGNMHFSMPFDPASVLIQVVTTATGIPVAWVGGFTITAKSGEDPAFITINNDGAVDWAVTDTVHLTAYE